MYTTNCIQNKMEQQLAELERQLNELKMQIEKPNVKEITESIDGYLNYISDSNERLFPLCKNGENWAKTFSYNLLAYKTEQVDIDEYYEGKNREFNIYKVVGTDKLIVEFKQCYKTPFLNKAYKIENGKIDEIKSKPKKFTNFYDINFNLISQIIYDKEFDKHFRPWFLVQVEHFNFIQNISFFEFLKDLTLQVLKENNVYYFCISF